MKSGGRGRLSTLFAGVFLLTLVVFAGPWVALIPMAALVSVMIMVAIGTFDWSSIKQIQKLPNSSRVVVIATVATVIYTHNLAFGVGVGVLLSSLFFANKIGRVLHIGSEEIGPGKREYKVVGQVFFTSAEQFINAFDFKEVLSEVRIDVSGAHFWDVTAIGALDKVVLAFQRDGVEVEVIGLNEASATMVDRFAEHKDAKAVEALMGC